MKRNIIIGISASLLLLSSCDYNEDNFPGFDELAHPKDVQNITMNLEEGDYKTIAGLPANKELALSKDPEGKSFVSALEAMGANKYFTEDAQALWYLPAFINNKHPYLDDGSKVTVNYKNYAELPEYLKNFNGITEYNLSSSDYKKVWGESLSAPFLSPSTLRKIPEILSEAVKKPADGAMRLVNYAYSETEPSIGGEDIPMVYKQVSELDAAGGVYVIAAKGKDGKYYPFGKLAKENGEYGYLYPDPIAVENGIISGDEGREQTITIAAAGEGYTMQNAWAKYIYMKGTFDSFNFSDAIPASGGEWQFNKNADGTFSIKNIEKNKTVKLNFFKDSYSYGSYSDEKFASKIYFEAAVAETDNNFTPQDVSLGEGLGYVWKYDTKNKYWKASAFINPNNIASESWLVSTEIDLVGAKNPVLVTDMILNFLKGGTISDYAKVFITDNYSGDVTTTTWTELDIKKWPAGTSWASVNTGEIDLSSYKDKKVRIAFKYTSTSEKAVTWEIENLYVKESSNYWDVYLFKEVPESEASPVNLLMASSTRAAASGANSSSVYRYDAASKVWKEFSTSEATVAVLQPADYEKMGFTYVGKPAETMPIYLQQTYPYAVKDKKVAVVYYADKDDAIAAKEFVFDGAVWSETTHAELNTIVFLKTAGKWEEAKVYYSSTLLGGDDGGFVIQDIAMGDLKYIWKLESSYGWKASGFNSSTKVNQITESWIISPEISLKKSVEPVLKFDIAINHLKGAELGDYFAVLVSTNYVDDVTTADWTSLTVEGLPEGISWDFTTVDEVDMSAFKDQVVRVAFRYKSDSKAANTTEIKNISIQE